MAKNLMVVESPAKAGTIKKYLGEDFEVLASYGHVRDLRPKEGAVDTDNEFAMQYEVLEKNSKHVDAITKAAKKAKTIYLATDLDREGEAISWHLVELLKERGVLGTRTVNRVVFHEITQRAIQEAVANPREISMALVNAQQARRALDYLVGFNLSPLLWKKIKRGLSAGRVQSPALRMICEREDEIDKFIAREYWTVESDLKEAGQTFVAKLSQLSGEKISQFTIDNERQAHTIRDDLLRIAGGALMVTNIDRKQRKRNPAPPFITSTLQQEAVRKLGFTAQRAMRVAQQLYEGIDIGTGMEGLITYMRTDSLNLAREAIDEIRAYVLDRFGKENVPTRPTTFKTNSKNAQEAHEAIRPTAVSRTPSEVKPYLSGDQYKLYELIWKRTVACQMASAVLDSVAVDLSCGTDAIFRATGTTVAFPGFLNVYAESTDDQVEEDGALPPLELNQRVPLSAIRAEQHFTEPPPRFSEATLVKTLEEYGIGRPSTYASIISTLQQREYVELDKKRFRPTDIGRVVSTFLTGHFSRYVDYRFTANLEDELDAVSRGERDWVPVLRAFWAEFHATVRDKELNVSRKEATQSRELGLDPTSGKPVSVRMGRYGPYVLFGTAEDVEKPKFFGLKAGQRLDTLTLEDAILLARLPRELGVTADDLNVLVGIGRFGPYIKYGAKYVSLKKEDDPYSIELDRALALIEEKQLADKNREIKTFPDTEIRVLNGRFGPYVTDGSRNARLPKDSEPSALTVETAVALLAESKPRRSFGRSTRGKKKATN
ncbi:MAG: DNA topoisomerase I [Gammaproteobacteria bacterium]|nr:DNA topoisomerase I [Gammaproteobacteria bacterium]